VKVSREVLAALSEIHNTRNMQVFRGWLRETTNTETAKAIKTSENVDVARGRAQMLMELQETIETAHDVLERLEKRNVKTPYHQ